MSETGTTGPIPAAELGPDHLIAAHATEAPLALDLVSESSKIHIDGAIETTATDLDVSEADDAGGVDPLTPAQEAELEILDDELDAGSSPAKKNMIEKAAYKYGYAKGKRIAQKAAKAADIENTRPIDPILAEQYDAAQADNLSEDISGLSDKELNDRLLEEGIENNPQEFHALGAESARREAEKNEAEVQAIFAELDAENADKKNNTSSFAAPKAEDRVVRNFVDAEGKPLVGFAELNNELARKVAEGDESDWNNLVQTLRDAVKNDASNREVSVQDRLETFEKYASRKYKELKANQGDGRVVVPPIVEQTPEEAAASPEKKRRARRWGAAVLGLAVLAGGALGLSRSGSDENVRNGVTAVESVTKTDSNINENGGVGDKPYGPEYKASQDQGQIGEAESGTTEHVFTVEVPYTDGAPTAWSWASNLGVTDIPGFLKEVMGDDWQDIAKGMKIGDTISASDEEIAQFTHNE